VHVPTPSPTQGQALALLATRAPTKDQVLILVIFTVIVGLVFVAVLSFVHQILNFIEEELNLELLERDGSVS